MIAESLLGTQQGKAAGRLICKTDIHNALKEFIENTFDEEELQ